MPVSLRTSSFARLFPQTGVEVIAAICLFAAYLATAKIGQFIFFVEKSSPALIWAPVGISLAAAFIWGYRMWLPILLAQIVVTPAVFSEAPFIIGVATGVGYAVQAVLGAYLLRRFRFEGSIATSRDAFLIILASLFITIIGPTFGIVPQFLLHVLPPNTTSLWVSWSRPWAGGILSVIIMTPLITAFYFNRNWHWQGGMRKNIELSAAFVLLVSSIYLLFWTSLPTTFSFPLIYLLCAVLFWISLSFGARSITAALFLLAAFGIAGSIISHPTPTPINFQLFADELFVILLAPIFLLFTSIMEERRRAAYDLAHNVVQLEEAMARLSAEDKSKNEFIAILAHELRNPLASVMSTFEVLSIEESLSAESGRMIKAAQLQTASMRRLLEDLLDVARVTQQKFKLQKERIDFGAVLTQSIENARQFIAERGHTFSMSLPPEPIFMQADPIRLEQMIVNLLNNAAKYTPRGGRIELASSLSDGVVTIQVRDNGIGIAESELENIFQPFNQIEGSVRPSGGLGIGLSLTRRLVEMHDGTITATSAGKNRGSTFVIRLPVTSAAAEAKAAAPASKPAAKRFGSEPVKVPYKILVVDDNESAAVGLGKLLQHNGHQVSLAHTGEHALQMSRSFNPEVMLLDIGLPDISGYEVAKELRTERDDSLTLIALTGFGQEEDKQRAAAAGFNYHLTKPVSIKDVESLLQSV